MENKMYDIGIIGAGPAGMTAAIYAGRAGKNVLLIDKEGFGGLIARSPKIENIPGFTSISGVDFASNMYEQVTQYTNIEHVIDEVKLLAYNHGLIIVQCDNEVNYYCKSIIIATGSRPRELKLDTKDVYYCVTCDGPFFKNKSVFVVGSGNTGATYALELATYCKEVFISDITMNMCCETELQNRIKNTSNIQWLPNCTIKSAKNTAKGNLSAVTLSTNETIKCQAIFSAIGMIPETEFAKSIVTCDKNDYIIAGETTATDIPNIFIAGDCRTKTLRQVTTAVSDGSIAASMALKYLRDNNI